MYSQETDHIAKGKGRLPEYLKGQPNLENLLAAALEQIQELEDTSWEFLTKRAIATAEGVQLDGLGSYFLVDRGTNNDEEYRARIKVRVFELTKSGQIQVLVDSYKSLTNADRVELNVIYPMTVELIAYISSPIDDEQAVLTGINAAKAAGIQLSAEKAPSVGAFKFLAPEGASTTSFGSTEDPPSGGTLQGVLGL